MKKWTNIFIVCVIMISPLNVYGTSGRLKTDSIVTCKGVTYGKHGDGHWHKASKNSNGSYNALGSALSSNPCTNSGGNSSGTTTPVTVKGCTNKEAKNYNSKATADDGSCTYYILGCTNSDALNFNDQAEKEDGSCIEKVFGCINEEAKNYNPKANVDDNSCIMPTNELQEESEEKEYSKDIEGVEKDGKAIEEEEESSAITGFITLGAIGGTIYYFKKKKK